MKEQTNDARRMFYPSDHVFTEAENLEYETDKLIFNATEDILVAMEDANVTKDELARRLSKSPSDIANMLSSDKDMTVKTLASIASALGLSVKITFSPK